MQLETNSFTLTSIGRLFCESCIEQFECDDGIYLFNYYVSQDNYDKKIKRFLCDNNVDILLETSGNMIISYFTGSDQDEVEYVKKYYCANHIHNEAVYDILFLSCKKCIYYYCRFLIMQNISCSDKIYYDEGDHHICSKELMGYFIKDIRVNNKSYNKQQRQDIIQQLFSSNVKNARSTHI